MSVPATLAFLTDLLEKRGDYVSGPPECTRLLELHGAKITEPTAFEPDPTTYRGEYYYNAAVDALYRKVITRRESGRITGYWQKVSS